MRNLSKSELDRIHGGLLRQAVASSLHPELGGNPPPSPVAGVPEDRWFVTPLIGSNQLSYGLEATTPFGTLSANAKQLSYTVQNALGHVTLGASLSSTGVATGTVTLPNVDNTAFTIKGSIDSNGQPSGGLQFTAGGDKFTINGSTSAWTAGIGFTDGQYSGTASYNFSTDSYGLSFTGGDVGELFDTPVSFEFNVFGLGSSNAGAGFEVYAGGKGPNGQPPIQPNVAGSGTPLHSESAARSGTGFELA